MVYASDASANADGVAKNEAYVDMFFDQKSKNVVSAKVFYKTDAKFTLEEFAKKTSESLNLNGPWHPNSSGKTMRISCSAKNDDGFTTNNIEGGQYLRRAIFIIS